MRSTGRYREWEDAGVDGGPAHEEREIVQRMVSTAGLIANGTLSAQAAASFWMAAEQLASFIVVARPRLAGKSTLGHAILQLRPPGTPLHFLDGSERQMLRPKAEARGGYLVCGEFSPAPVPAYIWGRPVRTLFDVLNAGYSLCTSLHANSAEETLYVLREGNGLTDAQIGRLRFIGTVRRFGMPDSFWRRLVAVDEIDAPNERERLRLRRIFTWNETGDRLEQIAEGDIPRRTGADGGKLGRRAVILQELAGQKASAAEVEQVVAEQYQQRSTALRPHGRSNER